MRGGQLEALTHLVEFETPNRGQTEAHVPRAPTKMLPEISRIEEHQGLRCVAVQRHDRVHLSNQMQRKGGTRVYRTVMTKMNGAGQSLI